MRFRKSLNAISLVAILLAEPAFPANFSNCTGLPVRLDLAVTGSGSAVGARYEAIVPDRAVVSFTDGQFIKIHVYEAAAFDTLRIYRQKMDGRSSWKVERSVSGTWSIVRGIACGSR